MKQRTVVPRAEIARAVEAINGGARWRDAADLIGIHVSTLEKRIVRDGFDVRRGRRTRMRPSNLRLPESESDLGYLAALLDGEGYITISYGKRWQVRVGITNTHRGVIDWLVDIGGNLYVRHPASGKTIYQWHLTARADVVAFLIALAPYMRMKRDKALLAVAHLQELERSR